MSRPLTVSTLRKRGEAEARRQNRWFIIENENNHQLFGPYNYKEIKTVFKKLNSYNHTGKSIYRIDFI